MALTGSTTTTTQINASRKRRRSSLGVKRLAELGREFTTGSSGSGGSTSGSNSDVISTTMPTNQLDNYATVHSTTSQTSSMPDPFIYDKNAVLMKIQFQITTAPELELSPPITINQKVNPLLKHRSNSTMVPTQSTASNIDEYDHQRRRGQLQKLHNQQLDQDQSDDKQLQTAGFKREHRRRPSTTLGVNLDSKGGFSNHVVESESSDTVNTMNSRSSAAAHTARSATFGSFGGGDTGSRHSEDSQTIGVVPRESIYFKRDGQRFGHEFTLKLSVDRSYRCLLKIKPLIPLQSISIQGHHIRFHDCTQTSQQSSLSKLSTNINNHRNQRQQQKKDNNNNHHDNHPQEISRSSSSTISNQPISPTHHLTKHFLHTHSHTHNSSQLIYVFDWSANRFEVNKNKARTEVQMLLKFKNGQSLMLPLQVKFYYSDCRQHLNWGSLLHFIDYDCLINKLGNFSINRVQFY